MNSDSNIKPQTTRYRLSLCTYSIGHHFRVTWPLQQEIMIITTILAYIATFLAIVLAGFYIYFKRVYTYWSKRNIPHATPRIPFGDYGNYGTKSSFSELYLERYKQFKDEKMFGMFIFHRPSLVVNDPELIKRVLIQDFMYFHDHSFYYNEKDDPLSAHLFAIKGAHWKKIRGKLSPTFTSGKMKNMFPIILDVADTMQNVLEKSLNEKNDIIEVKDLIARFSTDVIASCAFGIETNSLEKPDSAFRKMGKKFFEPTWTMLLKNTIQFVMPDLAEFLKLVVTDKSVTDFFMGVFKETVDYRKKNNVKRKDFIDLMIQLMEKGYIEDADSKDKVVNADGEEFTFNQAAAQAFIFFLGGFETSSSTLQFTLYELAKNQDIQDKLRQEIAESLKKTGGKMTYEGIHELKYLAMVLDESLRKYPPAGILNRECNQEYKVPGTDLVLPKGMVVAIPAYGLHMDPKYYPEPEKFIPERFSEEEKAKRSNYVYVPFGEGPRFCIGQRFAAMQMRVAMIALLSKYRVEMCEESMKTMTIDKRSLILQPAGSIYLRVKKLEQ